MSGKVVPLQGEESECFCAVADLPKAQALLPWLHPGCFYTFPLALWAAEEYMKERERESLGTSLEAEERNCLCQGSQWECHRAAINNNSLLFPFCLPARAVDWNG